MWRGSAAPNHSAAKMRTIEEKGIDSDPVDTPTRSDYTAAVTANIYIHILLEHIRVNGFGKFLDPFDKARTRSAY